MVKKFKFRTRYGLSGLIERFHLLGPFNNDGRMASAKALDTDLLADYGGETKLNVERFVRDSIPYIIGAGYKVNLLPIAKAEGAIIYGLALVESPVAQEADVCLGSDKGYKLFINDVEAGCLHVIRGATPDSNRHRVVLKKGLNRILIKVERIWGAYEFILRIEAPQELVQVFDEPDAVAQETIRFKEDGAHFVDFTRRLKYSGTEYFATVAQKMEQKFAFKATTAAQMRTWSRKLRAKLWELLGPEPEREDRKPRVLYQEEIEGGMIREKVIIHAYRDADIPCYLLRPSKPKGRYPCVLAFHGHGPGSYPVAGITFGTKYLKDSIELANYDYGLQLARKGCVVLCPTARGFGERGSEWGHDCDVYGLKAVILGFNLLALNLFDFMRCVDYLHRLPYVAPEKTGCIGLSQGGTFTHFLAAIDERIKVAVVSGAVGSWKEESIWASCGCGNQVLFGLLKYADLPDLLPLITPRGLCIESGFFDSCFMWPAFRKAHALVRRAYKLAGCPQNLCIDAFDGPHRFQGTKSIPFMMDCFKRI